MPRRSFPAGTAATASFCATRAQAEPKTVSPWHAFNIDTDMIYPGMKPFNRSQTEYKIEPRRVPGAQIVMELIRAIATGSAPIW